MRIALRPLLAAALLGVAVTLSSGGVATAATTPEVTADPVSIAAGETSTVTATGLGGLETASFGMGESDGATFTESGTASYDAPASNGSATATFTSIRQARSRSPWATARMCWPPLSSRSPPALRRRAPC